MKIDNTSSFGYFRFLNLALPYRRFAIIFLRMADIIAPLIGNGKTERSWEWVSLILNIFS